MLNALVIGCGRVGSAIALQLHHEGWDVTVVDENEDALTRLGGFFCASTAVTSVVNNNPATEAAFWSASLATFVGSSAGFPLLRTRRFPRLGTT